MLGISRPCNINKLLFFIFFFCLGVLLISNKLLDQYSSRVPSWFATKLAERKSLLRQECQNKPPNPNFIEQAHFTRFLVMEDLKLVFCYIPKVSCSTWKSVFYQALHNGSGDDVYPHEKSFWSFLIDYPPAERKTILDTYYKAMFVREPFSRLLSAYRDKVIRRDGWFRKVVEPNMSDHYLKDMNFPWFVRYVLSFNHSSISMNQHWRSYEQICPCEIEYDFIGHFENLAEEAPILLKKIGVADYVTFPPYDPYHQSKSRPFMLEYYSNLTREEIFKLWQFYELDFKLFGYDFPGPLQEIYDMKAASGE